ncbi:MAG: class I SAM-dependent methyltransferase [candidate division KSB1 bacterium]|nr:class I SAM-dependent methyltransferase [candidate division KSB1 bacterium]
MPKVDFDEYAEQYDNVLQQNIGKLGKNISYYAEHKVITLQRYLKKQPARILEFGCGTGRNIPFIKLAFPDACVWGCDVSRESLETARTNNPSVSFFHVDEKPDPLPAMDMVFVSCVFHHIPVDQRDHWMQYIGIILALQGYLFIFEHNPYNPLTQHAVNTCPFDKDAVLLRPAEFKSLLSGALLKHLRTDYILFFPAGLRRFNIFEKYLTRVPFGGQYMVMARK